MIKVGTDFSGIGAPEQALTNLGIDFESVFACEIDKYARKSFLAIHKQPKTFYEDITKRDHSEVEQLDLYVAGFPCQAFSMAGQRKGFDDVRGTLFFNVADFIRINQPKCFVLENVKGLISHDDGKTFQTIISLLSDNGGTVNKQMFIPYFLDGLGYHIYYKVMNTKHHGIPQNRERIFIVGFKDFRDFNFPKDEPLKLKLMDMLQYDPGDKFFLSDKAIKSIILNDKNLQKSKINGDVANAIQSPGSACRTYKGMNGIKVKSANQQGFEIAQKGDSINFSNPNSETRRARVGHKIANTLDTACNQGVFKDYKIRRLTPLECWRLQNFPDDQFFKAQQVNSDTQLYKQAGNSITVIVIQKIIKSIFNI